MGKGKGHDMAIDKVRMLGTAGRSAVILTVFLAVTVAFAKFGGAAFGPQVTLAFWGLAGVFGVTWFASIVMWAILKVASGGIDKPGADE